MTNLEAFLQSTFDHDTNSWQELLKKELKQTDISQRVEKKNLDTLSWPILSQDLQTSHADFVRIGNPWKKASQTYAHFSRDSLSEDLENGVRSFFFFKSSHIQNAWRDLENLFLSFSNTDEIEIFLLGSEPFERPLSKLNIMDEADSLSGRFSHEEGGNNTLELAEIVIQLIEKLQKGKIPQAAFVFLDSQFFKNLAKVQALKLLIQKVLEEHKLEGSVPIVGLNSYRDWTFFERYTNILRNNTSVASGLIADVDSMQSSSYQILFEKLHGVDEVHSKRAYQLSRNSFHVLSLESMLGVVQNSTAGSYHLEKLIKYYSEEAWKKMQLLLSFSDEERSKEIKKEAQTTFLKRLDSFNTRKLVLTGINDYPDSKEKIPQMIFSQLIFKRTATHFEELRLRSQKLRNSPKVCVGVLGDEALLSARINFCKNYFEVLGLEVFVSKVKEEIENHSEVTVICTTDESVPTLSLNLKAQDKFVAGKISVAGYSNIYAGQNIYEILSSLLSSWEEK